MSRFLKLFLAVSIFSALGGCASVNYIMTAYDGVPVTEVTTKLDTFRVFDKPAEGKMMITPSMSASFIAGATGASIVAPTPKPVFQDAAEAYLAKTARASCKIVDGYLLVQPQWEFRYQCGTA